MSENEKTVEIGGHEIELSNLDKTFFPDAGLTKGDLVDYYRRIADVMLPHLKGRPLTLQRFPDGIGAGGFYQKEAPDYFPDWINHVQIEVEEEGEEQPQITCENAATLVYLANQACITPHAWLSRADKLDYPDKMIFDLDPHGDFHTVEVAAKDIRELLEEVGLVPFVMTTGSRGLHVVVSLDRSADFDTVRDFARDLANVLEARYPDRYTTATRKKKRGDRLFLDYLRNSYAQHGVAPYGVRAKQGAPIATPLDWDELGGDLTSQSYTMENIFRRLGQKEDPWKDFFDHAQGIDEARERLEKL